ncbi:hypothetical protein C4559_03220 [Candidatus Microgenomates bacterium]|nr:MAG: hypothetical protein C4559_03220 [Candidatus Microgenomates bacterium]
MKNYLILIFIVIISIFSILPLFHSGFFPMHDDTQVARVFEMGKALKDGMFPVRWVQDLGYGFGYPIFNFYAPLAYYVGGFFNIIGFDALISTKIMIGVGIISAGFFMYLLAKEFFGKIGGIISSLFYVYAPYHALDLYVRGAVAEIFGYAFLPLAFYGLYKSSKEKSWRFIVVGSMGFAGVILSHNLTAFMLLPFFILTIFLLVFFNWKDKKFINWNPIFVFIFGIMLSSFYSLPAILEMKYTNIISQIGGPSDFHDHFVCLPQLWDSPWMFGGSIRGCIDGLSFRIGKLHILAVFISIIMAVFSIKKKGIKKESISLILAFLLFLMSIFLMLDFSKIIWEKIPQMEYIQYPWRYLLFASFASSFMAGSMFFFSKKLIPRLFNYNIFIFSSFAVTILILFYLNFKLFQPQSFNNRTVNDYTNQLELNWRISKISDEYLPISIKKPSVIYEINQKPITSIENVSVKIITNKSQKIIAEINSDKKSNIKLNIAEFPAWRISVDGLTQTFNKTENGLLLTVDKGKHLVAASYEETPIEKLGNIVTLIGVLGLILGIIKGQIKLWANKLLR